MCRSMKPLERGYPGDEVVCLMPKPERNLANSLSGYHADTPITIKAEPFIWPTAALINIHEHPI